MYAYGRLCENDDDYAQFALFFVRNRLQFNSRYILDDALYQMIDTIDNSHIMLLYNTAGDLIACVQYWYTNSGLEPDPHGDTVYVSLALIASEHRSSSVFFKGFRDMANLIAADNPSVKSMQFHAQVENGYLNRLYSKFTRHIGEREGYHGPENLYHTDFSELLRYLKRERK